MQALPSIFCSPPLTNGHHQDLPSSGRPDPAALLFNPSVGMATQYHKVNAAGTGSPRAIAYRESCEGVGVALPWDVNHPSGRYIGIEQNKKKQ